MDHADREQRVRQRAHEIWEASGGGDGAHEEHWHAAERAIEAEDAAAGPPPPRPQEKPAAKPRSVAKATAPKPAGEAAARPAAARRRPSAGSSPPG